MKKTAITLTLAALLLTGCSQAPAASEEKITFATEGSYAPYSYHNDAGELTGYDVDIAKAVAEKLDADPEFVETNWDGIIAGLDADKYEVIANEVSITPEREEKYLFSTPYTYSYGTLIVPQGSDITSFDQLSGKKVALTTTSNWAQLAESYGATIVPTSGFSESIQLVEQGRTDATINDNVTWLDYKKQKPDTNATAVAQSEEVTESAFLLRKDEEDLQKKIDQALKELKEDGTLARISDTYFGENISEPAQ